MTPLSTKYKQILWVNVLILSAGIGYLVYKKWGRIDYALGGAGAIGIIEYVVMSLSLARKQKKEEGGK